MGQSRVVIARFANGGIGDHLSCLIGSWWFAKQTGRTLIIDWRGSRFNTDASLQHNCFTDFFDHYQTLAGINVICDDSVADITFNSPYFPIKWNATNLSGTDHIKHDVAEISSVNNLVHVGHDISEPTVAFNQWISPDPPQNEVRLLLGALKFADSIQSAATKIWQENVGAHSALAIHIRHGNGENIGFRASYWLGPYRLAKQLILNASVNVHRAGSNGRFGDNMPDSLIQTDDFSGSELKFLHRIKREAEKMQLKIPNSKIILFCDSVSVAQAFRALIPNVIIPPKFFLSANSGPLHSTVVTPSEDRAGISQISFEMAMEMELMRRCSTLICMDSGFSIFSEALLDDNQKVLLKPTFINKVVEKIIGKIYAK
jgi:Nodulation protein Z (NodZ)